MIRDKKTKNRNENIDAIKGEGILLVVVGHIIQYVICKEDAFTNVIFCVIYSFHMPLFMFVSGYLCYKKDFDFNLKWLLKRMKRLLVPFFSWIIINWIFRNFLNENRNIIDLGRNFLEILILPDKGYWFLIVLFYNCVILFGMEVLIKSIEKKVAINIVYLRTVIIISGIFICRLVGRVGVCGLGLLGWHSFFYFGGYWIRYISEEYQDITKIITLKKYGFFFVISFLGMAICWRFNGEHLFLKYLYSVFDNGKVAYIVCKVILEIYRYMVPILGITTSFILIWKFPISWVRKFLVICGKYTLEIYILQAFLIRNYSGNIVIDAIISFVFAIVVSIGIAKVINYIPILNCICFGYSLNGSSTENRMEICK